MWRGQSKPDQQPTNVTLPSESISHPQLTRGATARVARLFASSTGGLVALNVIIFVLMAASSGHLVKFDGASVLRWGGNYGPQTMGGEWWRLLTATFVHIGLAHLLINMWCLYELGSMVEEIYGGPSMLLLYGLTGVAGGIVSLARNPIIFSAGASGAIFGLAGVLITALAWGKLTMPARALKIGLVSLLAFTAYNLTYGFLKGGVDMVPIWEVSYADCC